MSFFNTNLKLSYDCRIAHCTIYIKNNQSATNNDEINKTALEHAENENENSSTVQIRTSTDSTNNSLKENTAQIAFQKTLSRCYAHVMQISRLCSLARRKTAL